MKLLKLGKKSPRRDHRNLLLTTYMPVLPLVPLACDWSDGIVSWGMMLNDNLGCCTIAGPGHMIEAWTSNAGSIVVPPDASILSAYETIDGYNSDDPNTDQGGVILDVLNAWRQDGIAGHKIGSFVECSVGDRSHIEAATFIFGAVDIGVQLPSSAMQQNQAGEIWDVIPDDGGCEGGHCVCIVAYDAIGPTCVTWGMLQKMTWSWFAKYCDEAYACLSTDFLNGSGMTPSGFDLEALNADLKAVTN